MRQNPFYELYLADSMSAKEFVGLFSPMLLPHVQQLFSAGNVVVVGMQGSGKSMLLTLLKPETRLMYHEVGVEFPVPSDQRRFISCNVNLSHSNATDFGYRDWHDEDPREVEMLFGDFANVLLVESFIRSVKLYMDAPEAIAKEVGVRRELARLNEAARMFAASPSWEGWLTQVDSMETLEKALHRRAVEFRGYLHRRKRNLATEIVETKSPFGEPISEFATCLKRSGLLSNDTNVFVDIDQYEELSNIKTGESALGPIDYRSVINRAISRRDARVYYRIGSRRHSWRNYTNIMGSNGKLEEERDYKYVDLDLLLKRFENTRTYVFPGFAEDVFKRRMRVAGLERKGNEVTLEMVYGKSISSTKKGQYYNPSNRDKSIQFDPEWRPTTRRRLEQLAAKDILSARLGEAWIRQKGDIDNLDVRDGALPWEKQIYWKKERVEAALLQIASSNQQRPIYSGESEILDISSGNILVFISVNQHIWDQYFRFEASGERQGDVPSIGVDLQSIGIFKASEHWFNKLNEETGRSAERLTFVKEMSRMLREQVMGDRKLTYPGATGFSLKDEEVEQFQSLKRFLEEVADYGSFIMLDHTTKDKNRAYRKKFYLNPILCPYLRLPYKRIKEPRYFTIVEFMESITRMGIVLSPGRRRRRRAEKREQTQQTLF